MKDIIIVGTGAAGMTAAIYAKRYNLDPFLVGEKRGGTAIEAFQIENYPGFPKISGMDLMEKFRSHVESLGVEVNDQRVSNLAKIDGGFEIEMADGVKVAGKTVILALGTERRKLKVPGEEELSGKGVAYCATCDAPFFKDKEVAVVGGSDAATMAASLLTQYCPKVYLILRGKELKGEPIWIDRAKQNEKVVIINETNVIKINGEKAVESVDLDKPYEGSEKLDVQGVFIEIGAEPAVDLTEKLGLDLNEGKRIIVDDKQNTSIEGVYAAGDITDKTGHFAQIVNSAAQGAQAAYGAFQYLKDKK